MKKQIIGFYIFMFTRGKIYLEKKKHETSISSAKYIEGVYIFFIEIVFFLSRSYFFYRDRIFFYRDRIFFLSKSYIFFFIYIESEKLTVSVNSSDPLFKDDNVRFTTVPLKALSDQV